MYKRKVQNSGQKNGSICNLLQLQIRKSLKIWPKYLQNPPNPPKNMISQKGKIHTVSHVQDKRLALNNTQTR